MIRKATRTGIKPLIVLYSESGCGKTYSALVLARGLAGPTGKIVMGDSENGRGSLYADVPMFGGYDTLDIEEPFSPQNYISKMDEIEASGAVVGILDSGSHEWNGVGGVLDLAAENEARSGKGLHNWKGPKFEHQKFVQRLMRSRITWIVCLRAKFLTRQGKDEKGKTVIIKDDYPSPIQADDFTFEATCHGLIHPDHSLKLTKWSHPGLKACFPEQGPIELKHGELIAKWCAAGGQPATVSKPKTDPRTAQLKNQLWEMTKAKHNGDVSALESFLRSANLIDPDATLGGLTADKIVNVITGLETEGHLI